MISIGRRFLLQNRFLKIALLGIFILCITSCSRNDPVFHDIQGHEIQLSSQNNSWVIINYWASWCSACMKEIPELNHFYQHSRDKKIEIYAVNFDGLPVTQLSVAVSKAGILFPALIEDPRSLWNLEEVTVLPTTFIINPQGKIVKKIIGPSTETDLLDTLLILQQS